ncbi:MAG: 4Fe-4S dicluster domain-containing protein, partial [Desulfomonilaceae bacterium]
ISWGPNWEDDLAGVNETGVEDSNFSGLEKETYLRFRDVFMFHIPRICEHCLNPACVASCPSGALYKRDEDGIVLVDQERCRGWRYCVSGCPYKKVYFNWTQGRSEKCLFCYPRIESGLPTLCAHSCVGRIRYIGVILYDADRTCSAASVPDDRKVYKSHLDIFLNPHDIEVIREAQAQGISETMLQAAKRSPIYKLAVEWRLAFPPHPEFRTLPMVWYIPPLSPLIPGIEESQSPLDKSDFMRIPFQYLANLLSAGDQKPVRFALKRLMAVRKFMRSIRVEHDPDMRVLEEAEISEDMVHEMYNLIAIAKHGDRFVIPTTKRADTENMYDGRGVLGFPPGSQPEVS